MALTFPRAVFLEAFLNGWRDITSYVQQTSPVTIVRGRANEQAKVAPSKLTAILKNNTGDMSPSNPMGAFYGLLGRNTPLRWGFLVARDLFSRTVVDGLGSTTTGETWTLDGPAADFDVGGSTATVTIAAASTVRHAYLASMSAWADYEVTADVTVPFPNGTSNFAGLIFRGSTISDAWRLSITVDSTGVVNLNIADGAGALKGSVYTVDAVSAGTYRVRVLVEDGTVRGKAWPAASLEPYAWQVQHIAESGLNATGWVGIRARTGSGAANVTFSYDNVTVRVVRFHGEIADLKPRWDESHNIKWAILDAAGILRRLQQGNSPLLSTLRRGVLRSATPPLAYWPCEDGKAATGFAPVIGTTSIVTSLGKPKPAINDDFACSDLLPTLNGSLLAVDVPPYSNPNNAVQLRFLLSVPAEGDTPDGGVLCRMFTTGTAAFWDVVYYTESGGTLGFNAYNQAGTQVVSTGPTLSGNNGRPERIVVNLVQNGANVDWAFFVGPVPTDIDSGSAFGTSGTLTSHTFGLVFLMSLGSVAGFRNTACGHVSLHNAITSVLDLRNELGAYAGERAIDRFNRLCTEESLPSAYVGTPSVTAKMGPQRVKKLVDLLGECATADLGELYESRSSGALVLRAGNTLYNQTAAVTVDYSAKQVSAPLEPGADDQATRNDITVKRTNGSSYRVEQTTGQLNVANPGTAPDAVGRYDTSVEVNVHSDTQLPDIANWLLHLGTVKEDRYPKIRVDLAANGINGNAALEAALLAADIDDRVVVKNLSAADIFDPIDQIARGYTEIYRDEFGHEITVNTSPSAPYNILQWDDPDARWDSTGSTLTSSITSSATSFPVSISDGSLWTTAGGDFPFDVICEGEQMSISTITGAASPQTFTATRATNGVTKAHSAGAKISLARPRYWGPS